MTTYDENIKENPFHEALTLKHHDILERASNEGWIVCVPRKGAIKEALQDSDFYEHIIIPETSHTLNKTKITIKNNAIIIDKKQTRILFKETYYLKPLKYMIYCVEHLLNSNCSDTIENDINNVQDCLNRLFHEGADVPSGINAKCTDFFKRHKNIRDYNLKELIDSVANLYRQCRTDLNPKLHSSIETYMQHCVGASVFELVCLNASHYDANFNKIVRNLQSLEIRHFDDVQCYANLMQPARAELNKLNRFDTILTKMTCLKRTFEIFSNNDRQNLTTENLVELFAFLVIKLNISNWIGNLIYLKDFAFNTNEEFKFLLTTLEAAVEYIKSDSLFETILNESLDDVYFDAIRVCDLNTIKGLLKDAPDTDTQLNLCHPLCSCDKCNCILENKQYTINTLDCNGRNALHTACLYGYPHLVDYFLSNNAAYNIPDYSGTYAIHYATSRGHQNALLLLLHAGDDLNVQDDDGNTPLHLASGNGHENCVKALLYFSEQQNNILNINSVNKSGDTPLHLASKWGYLNLALILLQHNHQIDIKNNKNQTALDIAHNFNIVKLIGKFKNEKKNLDVEGSFAIRPDTIEQTKKFSLLLKAIENNDVPLTRYYLTEKHCHPLCTCEKCNQSISINYCDQYGFTALHTAVRYNRFEIVNFLLDSNANINLQTYKMLQTPLHLACINANVAIIEVLSSRCDLNMQDLNGNTALHYACFNNDGEVMDILLRKGADCNVKNFTGKSVNDDGMINEIILKSDSFIEHN